MLRVPHQLARVALVVAAFLLVSCGNARTVGEINVEYDEDVDFSEFQTFTVLTPELVPEADALDTDAKLFSEQVNAMIIDAMTAPPVCMTYIPPEEVLQGAEPDLYAGNGVTRETREGTAWECVPGWWWGVWGWFWDPCLWLRPIPIELDVGSLYLPVGPRPEEGDDPEPVFFGTAWKLLSDDSDIDAKLESAVRAIFQQWPVRRSCSP